MTDLVNFVATASARHPLCFNGGVSSPSRIPKDESRKMSLAEHLVEFRRRFLVAAIAVLLAGALGWLLADSVWALLRQPLLDLRAEGRTVAIQHTTVSSGFDTKAKLALFMGILLSSPVWLYQAWAFLSPALTSRERIRGLLLVLTAAPLFLVGNYLGWHLLPNIVRLLSTFQPHEDAFLMDAKKYLDFTIRFTVAVGFAFTFPAFLVFLNSAGILRGRTILKSWRIAILVITLFAGMSTPAADLLSMLLLAAPMVLLFYLAAAIALWRDHHHAKKAQSAADSCHSSSIS